MSEKLQEFQNELKNIQGWFDEPQPLKDLVLREFGLESSGSRAFLFALMSAFADAVWRRAQRDAILNLESPIKIIRNVFAIGNWAGTDGSSLEAEEAGADNRRQIGVYSLH